MKKILCLYLCFLFLASGIVYNVSAGDENDPEITDYEKDLIGARALHPLPKILYPFFKYIDIIAGWFCENQEQPDILLVSLKLQTFDYKPLNTRYVMWWSYDSVDYVAAFITHSNGLFEVGVAGYIDENGTEVLNPVGYSIDEENNIITFTIPKNNIGNPTSGDELLDPWIWTGCGFQNALLYRLWNQELAKDFTDSMDGRSYVVQY